MFVATTRPSYDRHELVKNKIDAITFDSLKNDEEFVSYLLSGSSSSDNIKGRINRAKEIIKLHEDNCDE